MAVLGVAETVNVSGGTPIIETSRSQVSSTITETSVQNLPVNGRNFIDFALLTPGVTRDVRTGDISFAGQRGTLNSLVVDGADNNNTFFGQTVGRTGSGRAPYQFSQDAVKEFQVNSNSFSAEYGRAGGAVINVVTKSGTNDLRGSVFEFYRDKALNANNAINELNNRPKSPYHYNQFGGTLGGPIRPNRDFFFVNYDGQRNTQPNVVFLNLPTTTPADAATQAGIARLQPLAESWNRKLDQDVFLVKTDHELNDTNRLSFRYNQQNFTGEGFENGGAQNSIEHTGASLVKTNTFNASWTSIIGTTFFNELKFQLARDKEPGLANSANPEAVVQEAGTTVLTIGRNNFSPRETTIKRWQLADTTTWLRGHAQVQERIRFSVRRHPEQLPRLLQRVVHVPHARVVCRRPAQRHERVLPAELPGARHDRPRDAPEHPRVFVLRAGRVEAAQRRHPQHGAAVRPHEDRPATGAQSRCAACRCRYRHQPTGRRHQQLGPTAGHRVEPARAARSPCAAAGVSSTGGRRRSCSARPTRTTASTSCR